MKNKLQKIIMLCLLTIPVIGNAQFQWGPPGTFGEMQTNQTKIGIGNFPNTPANFPQAKLHVNQFYLAADAPTNGELSVRMATAHK